MAKKFKEDSGAAADINKSTSLLDYVKHLAPDILPGLPIMEGASSLRFWQEIFQPMQAGEGKYWAQAHLRWPYAERLIYLSREFLRLDQRSQQYVIKAGKAQIWWRGDNIQQFRMIVDAHLAYRRLSEEERVLYRKRLMLEARAVVRPG